MRSSRLALAAAILGFGATAPAQTSATSAEAPADTTLTVRAAGSALEFLPARFSLKQGLRVQLRFTNDGSLPHNLVLAKSDADLDEIATEAYGASATGYVPASMKDRLLVASELVSPGQSVLLSFVVPPPGEYTFICLFPGHANMMVGTLRALR
jgi:uncharacterized cupredoxin-like copper-binding protein